MKLGEAGEAFFVEQISNNDIDVSYPLHITILVIIIFTTNPGNLY